MFKVPEKKLNYSKQPEDNILYTEKMNIIYTRYAKAYDYFMMFFPLWKKWLRSVLPYIKGDKILEVSFGPAYLLTMYPEDSELYALDYNNTMVERAKIKMERCGRKVDIIKGNVEDMPYPDDYFDTVINTMAFTGYPDGEKALSEMIRVLKPDGVLLLLDYDYPINRNLCGYLLVRFIELCGDIIKDIDKLIKSQGLTYQRKIVGGFGSIQLFIIENTH